MVTNAFTCDTITMKADYVQDLRHQNAELKYDAVSDSRRRRSIHISSKSEDTELKERERQSLISQGRDLLRNFTLAGFVIRKHLQYVADFNFQSAIVKKGQWKDVPQETIDAANDQIEAKMKWWSRRENCDISRRHSLSEIINLIETHRIIDGDCGIVKHNSGHLQAIEGDRIRTPSGVDALAGGEWSNGVKTGKWGQAYRYGVSKRLRSGGFEDEREISVENMLLVGYFTRFDQFRGVGPLAPSIIQFSHLYEGIEYALAKSKLSQLLGLLTTRGDDEEIDDDDAAEFAKKVISKFGPDLLHIDGATGDEAMLIESKTPSIEFQQFVENVIRIAFASLDIPYSFFDGSKTNFFGSKGELNNYIDSCNKKQAKLIEMLTELTEWLLPMWIMDGDIELPTGFTVDDIPFVWKGAGIPYWRLIDDSKGYELAVLCGFMNPEDIASAHQQNIYENIDKTKDVIEYARSKGIKLVYDNPYVQSNVDQPDAHTLNIGI